jgi:hypothetical protein
VRKERLAIRGPEELLERFWTSFQEGCDGLSSDTGGVLVQTGPSHWGWRVDRCLPSARPGCPLARITVAIDDVFQRGEALEFPPVIHQAMQAECSLSAPSFGVDVVSC